MFNLARNFLEAKGMSRRGFLKGCLLGVCLSILHPFYRVTKGEADQGNPLFWIKNIPIQPFWGEGNDNAHIGIEHLLHLMGDHGVKFYRSSQETVPSGPSGMIASNDIVLIKVNAQWKYRGCTNSDLIRGLIQGILDHPDGFTGEVVIFENGQGRGSLNCDTSSSYGGDTSVHANANNESHSFLYLVDTIFNDPRVSAFLLDPIRGTFIGATDHVKNGYRRYENVSYPCFTTSGGHRVELREGVWTGSGYSQNLKLINVPVLKYHDTGGSEITASLKHFYGIVSMSDGQSSFRHYSGLGETCGKMAVSVRTPVLNIIDAIWVSYSSITGYPASTTLRANQILASQDPVALDYWAAKYIMYPISKSSRHLPTFSGIDQWLSGARDIINGRGGIYHPDSGILVGSLTKNESEMTTSLYGFHSKLIDFNGDGRSDLAGLNAAGHIFYTTDLQAWTSIPGKLQQLVVGDFDGDGQSELAGLNAAGHIFYTTDLQTWTSIPGELQQLVVGDFDGDGQSELAGLNAAGHIFYTTDLQTWINIPGVFQQLVVGDFDGNGRSDLAGLAADGNIFYTTDLQTWINIPGKLQQLVTGDFDGDGQSDLAGINSAGNIFYTTDLQTWINIPGELSQIVVGDLNGDGRSELAGLNAAGHIFYTTNLQTWTNIPGVLEQLVE